MTAMDSLPRLKDEDFETWLISTSEERARLREAGKAVLPLDAGERHNALEKSIQDADTAERLALDADGFVIQAKAMAVFPVREKFPKLTADERRKVAESYISKYATIAADCGITARTLRSRVFAIQNQSRSR